MSADLSRPADGADARSPLSVVPARGGIDVAAAERAAADLLAALGMDLADPTLAATPGRFARLRGVQARGATTVTSALLGLLRTDSRSRAEFLSLTQEPR